MICELHVDKNIKNKTKKMILLHHFSPNYLGSMISYLIWKNTGSSKFR